MASTDTASFARALAEQPVSRSTGRRPLFALVVLALLGLLCTPLFVNRVAHNAPHPVAGEVSFASWGELTAPVDLGGEWMLVWHGDSTHPSNERIPIKVPGPWKGLRTKTGETLPESGFGTYELTIRDLPPGQYLFHAPIIDAGSRIWIDGQVVSAMGTVGNSAATTRYMVRSQDVPFVSTGEPVHIAIDIASFFHRDNGLEAAPVMGLAAPMRSWASLKWAQDFLFRRRVRRQARGNLLLNRSGEFSHSRCLEQALDRHFDFEHLAQTRDQLDRQQRMAAELEELVVDAHRRHAQEILPDAGDLLLNRIAGRGIGARKVRPRMLRGLLARAAGCFRAERRQPHPLVEPRLQIARRDRDLKRTRVNDPEKGILAVGR